MAERSSSYYKQGNYTPINQAKYRGKWPVFYRSSWEKKLCIFLDNSSAIKYWGIESIQVPYIDPTRENSKHMYVVDFYFVCKDKETGKDIRFLAEVKPYAQTIKPVRGKKKEMTFIREAVLYVQNVSKWKAAKQYAERHGFKFIVITEKDISKIN